MAESNDRPNNRTIDIKLKYCDFVFWLVTNSDTTKFEEIIVQLFQTAGEDGVVSEEEGAIIMKVKQDLQKYIDGLKQSQQGDNSLTQSMQLIELKNDIISNAGVIAAGDYEITDDEKVLIRKLIELLSEEI